MKKTSQFGLLNTAANKMLPVLVGYSVPSVSLFKLSPAAVRLWNTYTGAQMLSLE